MSASKPQQLPTLPEERLGLYVSEVVPQFMSYQGHCQTELGMGISYSNMEKEKS